MSSATTLSTPADQVTALMQQVADESGLEIQAALPAVATGEATVAQQEQDALTRRCIDL